jgi:hypothetical protein
MKVRKYKKQPYWALTHTAESTDVKVQGEAEITPTFGGVTAQAVEGVQ